MAPLTTKVMTWSDSLRLPQLVSPAEMSPLIRDLTPLFPPRSPQPFQSKQLPALKRNVWFVMRHVPDAREGLLCLWPEKQACVFVTAGPRRPRVALLRVTVDPQFYTAEGRTVFAASIHARRLVIEDTLVWKGRDVTDELFAERFCRARSWLIHSCMYEARSIGGLELECAAVLPLESVRPDGMWEFIPNEGGRKRLVWEGYDTSGTTGTTEPVGPTGPLIALASREPGPDQWVLSASDGVVLGRALIRTLAVSTEMRSAPGPQARVIVEWNPTFTKWELLGMAPKSKDLSSSDKFVVDT